MMLMLPSPCRGQLDIKERHKKASQPARETDSVLLIGAGWLPMGIRVQSREGREREGTAA